jgi:hypothetical protein
VEDPCIQVETLLETLLLHLRERAVVGEVVAPKHGEERQQSNKPMIERLWRRGERWVYRSPQKLQHSISLLLRHRPAMLSLLYLPSKSQRKQTNFRM